MAQDQNNFGLKVNATFFFVFTVSSSCSKNPLATAETQASNDIYKNCDINNCLAVPQKGGPKVAISSKALTEKII